MSKEKSLGQHSSKSALKLGAWSAAIFSWPVICLLLTLSTCPACGDIALVLALPFLASWIIGGIMALMTLIRVGLEIKTVPAKTWERRRFMLAGFLGLVPLFQAILVGIAVTPGGPF